ncbi:hypothetical protein [Virgibacillus siamensis]|uniref:hypothetical protein n=1 Tax=Virgibacillus siamensis TaxID=480071 RepID=UPI000984864E|nr:hypothetical protein [Virgibacillus siamensis]
MKKRWTISGIGFVIILMVVIYVNFGLPWNYFEAREAFQQHLSSYKEEMEIDKVHYDFLHGGYHGEAHLKNNPDFQFYIGQNQRTGQIEDGYAYQRLRERANKIVNAIVNRYLPTRLKPGPEVEITNFEQKALEINIVTEAAVDNQVKKKIKQAIIQSGFKPDQLMFAVKRRGRD